MTVELASAGAGLVLAAGLGAGALHALAGPDHLAGVAPFAAASARRAWRVGVGWGLGHASGALLGATAALALRAALPGFEEHLSAFSERAVGVLLCLVGAYGLHATLRARVHVHRHAHATAQTRAGTHAHDASHAPSGAAPALRVHASREHEEHEHVHLHLPLLAPHAHDHGAQADAAHPPSRTRLPRAAFGVGLLHGLAGLAHLFAVLPALALPGLVLPGLYLAGYALASLAAVTGFAATVGWAVPGSKPRRLRAGLLCASAASLLVGLVWIVHPF